MSTSDGQIFVPEHPNFGGQSIGPPNGDVLGFSFQVPSHISFTTVLAKWSPNGNVRNSIVAIYQAANGGEGVPQLIAYGSYTTNVDQTVWTLNTTCTLVPGTAFCIFSADQDVFWSALKNIDSITPTTEIPIWDFPDRPTDIHPTQFFWVGAHADPPAATLDFTTASVSIGSDTTMLAARGYTP